MSLSAELTARVRASHTGVLDLGTAELPIAVSAVITLTNGTGANQVDRLFSDTRVINASSNDDLDLAGVLTDAFGATITFARIKAIYVKAAAGNTNNVVVGGAASAQLANVFGDVSDKIVVRPGGFLLLAAPDVTAYAVTATTADILRIANSSSGTSVSYDIVLLGCSV